MTEARGEGRTGVVLLNMGGPASLDEIPAYLRRIFMDPLLIRLPLGGFYRPLLAGFVASRRGAKVRHRYALIGGKSPLLEETRKLAALLSRRVDVPIEIAMRYSSPSAAEAVAALEHAGVSKVVAVPLYPQYSSSTTASSVADLEAAVGDRMELIAVQYHYHHPGVADAMAQQLNAALEKQAWRSNAHVLFTAHSIPESYTRTGDPYVEHVRETVEAVAQAAGLSLPYSLAFQSATRFGSWHGPSVFDAVEELAEGGVRHLVVAPVSFVSENLETLFDLDIQLAAYCQDMGLQSMLRVPTLSESNSYADALADLIRCSAADVWGAQCTIP